jgi:hypothetical protein
MYYRALPLIVSCCTLSESDLSLWFPTMASPNIFLAKVLEAIVKDTSKNKVFDNHGEDLNNVNIAVH